ncbi:MAG: EscU/YscU/HrcU family type III secretion system export apparatus switch protein [Lachnospiraceae bacterium]|nr:EscU/YscU/HrcU family type III secretion system export apparatus switch protein [Lachnospiraceae bacterium]
MEEDNRQIEFNGKKIVLNKSRQAVALAYNPGERAPKIIAKGKGHVAEKILDKAKEENIPIHQDEKLAESLSNIELGDYIPPELYEVVAEVLVYVDDMDRIKSKLK